jgi:hypothetical protein
VNDPAKIITFAKCYAEAWCNQNPESVASFFAENGSLKVNERRPPSDARRLLRWREVSCAIFRT